jgi:ABC-type nitrate/sulfonate/bicarbonate transport system permease component
LRGLPNYVLSPVQIARHFSHALGSGELYEHLWASLARSLRGFAIGTIVGAALGLAAGMARWFDRLFSPAVFLTYPVPRS